MPVQHSRDMDHPLQHEQPAPDLLLGTRAIAQFLGVKQRQALYQIESGRLPHFRIGKIVAARRSSLHAWIAEQEAKATRKPA